MKYMNTILNETNGAGRFSSHSAHKSLKTRLDC